MEYLQYDRHIGRNVNPAKVLNLVINGIPSIPSLEILNTKIEVKF